MVKRQIRNKSTFAPENVLMWLKRSERRKAETLKDVKMYSTLYQLPTPSTGMRNEDNNEDSAVGLLICFQVHKRRGRIVGDLYIVFYMTSYYII